MTNKELSEAIFKVADGFYALAEALAGRAADEAPDQEILDAIPELREPPTLRAPTPKATVIDPGICPKHLKPYKDGSYGPYCTSTTDDPAWANKRGYCTINPKNAPKWVEIHTTPLQATRVIA